MPPPLEGEALSIDGHRLSVHLSVRPSMCPVPGPKWRTEWSKKLKFSRKEACDTKNSWPHLDLQSQHGWGHVKLWDT